MAGAAHAAMEDERFWALIDQSAPEDQDFDARLEKLGEALSALSLDALIGFEITFRRKLNEAYRWDLWGAAYVANGGCSDDGFEYFRRWLVSRGEAVYKAALADPDSLASLDADAEAPQEAWDFEEVYYVAGDIFADKGGEGDLRDRSEPEAGGPGPGPLGEPFDEDEAALEARYPRLWARFGG